MRHYSFAMVGVVLSLGLVGCGQPAAAPKAALVLTPSPCTVALAAGAGQSERDRQIARTQDAARGGARDAGALERLGYLYVARARVNNDPGDYKLAQMAAECLDSRHPGDPAALLLRGHVFHQLHRFREAEQMARALVAKREVVLDYGLLGDALMEQGRLSEAAAAYQKMIDLKPFYQSYTRAAHLRWLKGDLDGAIDVIRLAIDSASPRDPESAAWAWTRMAAYQLQAGRLTASLTAAETALKHQPDYAAALLAQGRTLLAMHREADAVELLRRAVRLNPLPEYQWAFADALRLRGLDAEAESVEQLLTARGEATDPRTLALYLATRRADPSKALALAEEEMRNRADIFTLDAHAWALAANGRVDEARDAIERAVAEGTMDARLFLHAGLIHAAAGRQREAMAWLKRADALRATLLPSEAVELTKNLSLGRRARR
jgi:tetratricopeptide (TPR) repeat protein